MKTSVLVTGGGPVGLTAAMDLAWRGIDVVVVELRHRSEPPNVKCNHVAARSMEIVRRLGVAQALRSTGLPEDYANDISYRTTTLGTELTRIHIPCRRDRYSDTSGPDGWWPTPEPPHRINQIFLEPVLFAHAERMAGITILNRTSLEGYSQDAQGVGRSGDARCLSGGAAPDHRAGLSLCDEPLRGDGQGAARGSGRYRGAGPGGRRNSRPVR